MMPSDFIGKIVNGKFKYYNSKTNQMDVKARPFFIIKCESNTFPCDFNGFPLSSINHSNNIDVMFDVKIETKKYPLLKLRRDISYIRVHKMQTLHSEEINRKPISSIVDNYGELYLEIIEKFDLFCASCF